MKCRKCDYPLWNLTEPRCPECGDRFDVLSYWFEPGSVVFKCPYCGHRHVGRDARGLPFDAGRCEGCRQMLVVEQMPAEPANGSYEMEVRSDDDFSLVNRRKSPAQKRAVLALMITAGVIVVFALLWAFLRLP
jgi:Zn ribbon nucleic-acid-binding protein